MTTPQPIRRARAVSLADLRLPMTIFGAVAVMILAPLLLSGTNLLTFDLALVYAMAAVGLYVIFGLGGLLSIAQAAVMAVGAYLLVLTMNAWSIGMVPALVLATVGGALASGLTGLIAIRIRSHYFILASVALAEGVLLILTNEIGFTGGSNGVGLAAPTVLFGSDAFGLAGFGLDAVGLDMSDPAQFALLAVPLLAVVWYVADSLRASRLGMALDAARGDDYLALASGIPIHRVRLWATVVGGAFGGLAGAMLALLNSYIGPQDFGVQTAVLLLLMVVAGGTTSITGVVLAALLLTFLTQGLLTVTAVGDLVYGLAIVLLLIFTRRGLAGLGRGAYRWVLARVQALRGARVRAEAGE